MKKNYSKILFLLWCALFASITAMAQTTVLPFGSSWKYLDNGSNQGTAWRASAFSDATWVSGNAPLGYPSSGISTVVSYGPNSATKYLTTYFRKSISVANPSSFSSFTATVKRDDGVAIYLNGVEVYRNNLVPNVAYNVGTASGALGSKSDVLTFNIPASSFVAGNNVFAVEIHQQQGSSSDIFMDLEVVGNQSAPASSIVAYGASWKYLDNGTNQGTAWKASSFSDSGWASGVAPLGYSATGVATTVGYGPNSSAKYITTYFRKAVTVNNPSAYTLITGNVKRDDGVAIYVNGTEVYRNNLSVGATYTTTASLGDNGATPQTFNISPAAFINGTNVIAVEIHQQSGSSSDIFFDLDITGSTGPVVPTITRGPYLQMGGQTGLTLRWRTNIATNSTVKYGTSQGSLTSTASNALVSTEHEVSVTGLTADTKYFYSIGSSTEELQSGASNYFRTAPTATTNRKIRVAAFGDCGNNSTNQVNTKNALLSYLGSNPTDVWLLLGDNAYESGYDNEYQTGFFDIYKNDLLKNTYLYPSAGNHDYANSGSRQDDHNIPYLANFTMPKNAELGGVASGKEEYYSFNYGDIHFVCLDAYGQENNKRFYDVTSTQAQWLVNDLNANTKKWTIAYWHHPPYTKGSHDSDASTDLVAIRQNLISILENKGVDLIVNGHSHVYERSLPLKNNYGLSSTYSPSTHAVSTSSGRYDGSANSGPYISTSNKVQQGTVYVVAGSSGKIGGSAPGYPLSFMKYSNNTQGGSFEFEIQENRLDAKFIGANNAILDQFTMMKDVNQTNSITVAKGQSVTLTASWIGNYVWSSGQTTKSITFTAPTTTGSYTYNVKDNAVAANKYLQDNFTVNVVDQLMEGISSVNTAAKANLSLNGSSSESLETTTLNINTVNDNGINLNVYSPKATKAKVMLTNANGQKVKEMDINLTSGTNQVDVQAKITRGLTIVVLTTNNEKIAKKIIY